MSATHDAIIVGSGPAGSTAALVLAQQGADVLILDRAVFPRDKLCAGLLTWKTMDALERVYGETPSMLLDSGVVNAASSAYRIRYRDRVLSQHDIFYPFHFTQRRVFDAHLLERAMDAGAVSRQGCQAVAVDPKRGTIRLADGEELTGRYLIGCDGVTSLVRRSCHFDGANWRAGLGGAMEIRLDRENPILLGDVHTDLYADRPTVYAGFLRAGYGWVFPHRDKVVIGIGGHSLIHGHEFVSKFKEFLTFLGLPPSLAETVKGHALPYGNYLPHPWYGRTLLAGDAAGLVEALFGEGIYYALHSGELAGQAVADALANGDVPQASYDRGLKSDILPELSWSRKLRRVLYTAQNMGFLPLFCFLHGGRRPLDELIHGVRSYRLLRRRANGPGE